MWLVYDDYFSVKQHKQELGHAHIGYDLLLPQLPQKENAEQMLVAKESSSLALSHPSSFRSPKGRFSLKTENRRG